MIGSPHRARRSVGAALLALALVAAACGDADEDVAPATDGATSTTAPSTESSTTVTTSSTTSTTAPTTVAPSTSPPTTLPATTVVASTTAPPPPATPLRPGPLVAITADGDAVYFPALDAEPVLLFDGPHPDELEVDEGPGPNVVDGIAILPDASRAWVGLCCEPIAGVVLPTRPPTPASYDVGQSLFGYGPAIDPSGRYVAVGAIFGAGLSISPVAGGDAFFTDESVGNDDSLSPYDTMWLGPDLVAILAIGGAADGPAWVVRLFSFDGTVVTFLDEVPVAGFDDAIYFFAGVLDGGRVAVHAGDTERVLAIPVLDATGETETIVLDRPARTVWFSGPDPDVVVDIDGVLRVGGEVVPGEYRWARR